MVEGPVMPVKIVTRVDILPDHKSGYGTRLDCCKTPDEVIHLGPAAIGYAARHLIATGSPPGRLMRVYRGDMLCLYATIGAFARTAWGGKLREPAPRKWVPNVQYPIDPALQAWFDAGRPVA